MLELKNISKYYEVAGTKFTALNSINLKFRKNEFVSILGPSGSGKTTMLNIIGGLDRYSEGDLVINGVSTKQYKDKDWDSYRNHSIGFVFQSYNLISHQTILSNVELALTLSGVNKKERREKAIDMLTKVGLKEHINKKPTQLSGGQMQRVAIARALINDPEIILADEPTGALDTETSQIIMQLLQDIAKVKLVIMVTHNDDIAEHYFTRIVKILDGELLSDSNPIEKLDNEFENVKNHKEQKTSMSFFTALGLSFNNLLTKKARTILTAFAGSIGIIGIALILSLSTGANKYIDKIQADTLTTYPIQILDSTIDLSNLTKMGEANNIDKSNRDKNKIYPIKNTALMLKGMNTFSGTTKNNLNAFKEHIENNSDELNKLTNSIDYVYNTNLNIYKEIDGKILALNPFKYVETPGGNSSSDMSKAFSNGSDSFSIWTQLMGNSELLNTQYEVVSGTWPKSKEELVLFVNANNEISDLALYQLGLLNPEDIKTMQNKLKNGEEINVKSTPLNYDKLVGLSYKYIPSVSFYEQQENKTWIDKSKDEQFVKKIYDNALELKIVGIVKPRENTNIESTSGKLGYTKELSEYIIENTNNSEIAKLQLNNKNIDVFTNKEFLKPGEEIKPAKLEELPENIRAYVSSLPQDKQNEALLEFSKSSQANIDDNLKKLGILDLNSPSRIDIYPNSYENKDKIDEFIKSYNKNVTDKNNEIKYNDLVGMIMSSVSTIINVISYLLIGFVSISLIVSSIMIGIITYVSVLERTKEIGILKSIGASRKDISRVFNSETIIVGLFSGSMGILITILILIPANMIIEKLTGVSNFAVLQLNSSLILVSLSTILTLISGLIPSRIASKKDAVEALRSE